jgi:hypothetical protein
MSVAVGFSMPCFEFAFFVWRVADQSLSSAFPFTTRRGKVSESVSVYMATGRRVSTMRLCCCRHKQQYGGKLHLDLWRARRDNESLAYVMMTSYIYVMIMCSVYYTRSLGIWGNRLVVCFGSVHQPIGFSEVIATP